MDDARARRPEGLLPGRVVVIGGNGFIGRRAVERLVESGHEVDVVGRRRVDDPVDGVRYHERDAATIGSHDPLLDDVMAVVFAATGMLPAASNHDPVGDAIASLTPLLHLLEALRSRPGTALVFLSSGGTVYGRPKALPLAESHTTEPLTSYGIMKLAAEKYIGMYGALYGVRSRILRIANAYGPCQPVGRHQGVVGEFIQAHLEGRPIRVFGTGAAVRDYIHVDDVARAIELAVGVDLPPLMNVGSGVGHSVSDLIQLLAAVSGRTPNVEHVASRPFDLDAVVLDVSMFRSLQFQPPIPLEEGLADAWAAAATLGAR